MATRLQLCASMRVGIVMLSVVAAACGGNRDAGATADSAAAAVDTAAGRVGAAVTGDSGAMAPGTAAGTSAMMTDPSTGPQLDSLTTAARGGVAAMKQAVPVIQRLEDKLDNSNDPALTDIAKDLEKLREELADDTPDGPDIASILERVGPKMTSAAANAGPLASSMRSLGQQLGQAAGAARGGR